MNINHHIDNETIIHLNIDSICLNFKGGLLTFATFDGLKSGELVQVFNIENDLECGSALVMNLTPSNAEALLEDVSVREGWGISSTANLIQIEAGLQLFNTIINYSLGVDVLLPVHVSSLDLSQNCLIETRAPNILDRKSVHQPLHSGLKSVDSLIPIGLGQREFIIGDRQTGKTTIGFDLWQNQTNLNFFLNNVYFNTYFLGIFNNLNWLLFGDVFQPMERILMCETAINEKDNDTIGYKHKLRFACLYYARFVLVWSYITVVFDPCWYIQMMIGWYSKYVLESF